MKQAPSKIRNLDELQESDARAPRGGSRLGALAIASLGGACLVLATVGFLRKPKVTESGSVDPLGALVEQSNKNGTTHADPLQVTFPELLGNGDRQTTALEVVRDVRRAPEDADFKLPEGHPTSPPEASDRLPVVPLPAQHILAAAGKELSPHNDTLTTLARTQSRETGTEVLAGTPGGFQLQVSSFAEAPDAAAFAAVLRRRGHRAYVEAANVKDRGVWHRVRVGPFKYKRSADIYRQEFEAKERLVTFVVSPPKTKTRVAQVQDSE